jgi:hypothetical protein
MSKRKIGSPGFLLALASMVLIYFWLFPPCGCHNNARRRARRVTCANNLKQIGITVNMYAGDHDNLFPDKLRQVTQYVGYQPQLFVCSESRNKPESIETVDKWTDYVYISGLTATSSPNAVLAYCQPKNHKGEGGNVLSVDGHIEWFNAKGNASGEPSFDDVVGTLAISR